MVYALILAPTMAGRLVPWGGAAFLIISWENTGIYGVCS